VDCLPRRRACHPGLVNHRVVSLRRSVQRQRSSLACPIRSRRRLGIAHEGQHLSFVQRFCDNVQRYMRRSCIAGHCLPHCRRNSGTCMVLRIEEGWYWRRRCLDERSKYSRDSDQSKKLTAQKVLGRDQLLTIYCVGRDPAREAPFALSLHGGRGSAVALREEAVRSALCPFGWEYELPCATLQLYNVTLSAKSATSTTSSRLNLLQSYTVYYKWRKHVLTVPMAKCHE